MNEATQGALKRIVEEVKEKRAYDCLMKDCVCNHMIGGNDIDLVESWINENDGAFPITYVSREDVAQAGFDVSAISDSDMRELASKMADAYCDSGYWESLEVIAEESLGFAKKLEVKNE